ncbi:MAG TPA: hypothetical protein QF901_05155, partial [Gammaproteobacteria bacterium]|nr:hypothetical protein [Gammaproteobacteria bacterium]
MKTEVGVIISGGSALARRCVESNRGAAVRYAVAMGSALIVACAHAIDDGAAAKADESIYSGVGGIPGAINLGLTGRRGKTTSGLTVRTLLEKQRIATRGTYTESGRSHFGGDLGEDVRLVRTVGESVSMNGHVCPENVPRRVYDISAINVEITLNQYHDFFPGYMYVLTENVDRVREDEAANEEARWETDDPGTVSNGLQGDVIQPLAIRVNQGECLVINLTNDVEDEDASFHLHGSSLVVSETGQPATSVNPDTNIESGAT